MEEPVAWSRRAQALKFLKKYKFTCTAVALVLCAIIAAGTVLALRIQSFWRDGSLTTEEWADMMLTEYREDVETLIADWQLRKSQGVIETHISNSEEYSNSLYQRLMKKCCAIDMYEDGTIAFHRNGFLTGYTGFYYSPSGIQTDVSEGADWYKTGWLEGDYFWFQFGY